MKTLDPTMTSHINQEVTTLATIWTITRTDGEIIRMTDHDVDIVYDGDTYAAASAMTRTAIQSRGDMSVDNLEVQGILSATGIAEAAIRDGLYDFATVEILSVDWTAPDAHGRKTIGVLEPVTTFTFQDANPDTITRDSGSWITDGFVPNQTITVADAGTPANDGTYTIGSLAADVTALILTLVATDALTVDAVGATATIIGLGRQIPHRSGILGEAKLAGDKYEVEMRGLAQMLERRRGSVYTPDCRADLYSPLVNTLTGRASGCGVTQAGFKDTTTVQTVVDRREFTVQAGLTADPTDYYDAGPMKWTSGLNNGLAMEVKSYTTGTKTVVLFLAMPHDIAIGDTLDISAGCDKLIATCNTKFSNSNNFQGEPNVPGEDATLASPDAK